MKSTYTGNSSTQSSDLGPTITNESLGIQISYRQPSLEDASLEELVAALNNKVPNFLNPWSEIVETSLVIREVYVIGSYEGQRVMSKEEIEKEIEDIKELCIKRAQGNIFDIKFSEDYTETYKQKRISQYEKEIEEYEAKIQEMEEAEVVKVICFSDSNTTEEMNEKESETQSNDYDW